ncbi:uncharacterized protein LOC107461594 [Arachis duranensis]|uniref:Uncharacterized protein LOC107461594 n=1 Tax=Arachis duranensis TaxID=130453 RepID=A0A6P4B8K0_ARADU|nr:uncharacterized protein LOC107461594 [Arachis duranensis]
MMKGMELLCSSSASTAIASSVHPRSKRYSHCSSQLPIIPKKKIRRNSSSEDHKLRRKSSVNKVKKLYGQHCSYADDSPTGYLLIDDTTRMDACNLIMNKQDDTAVVATTHDQVVVLRVSLHCKACEGKLRKHISKMEGVKSFNIDMEAKKVTIMGHVTPLGVLASLSKVKKNAQLWPSPTSSLI